MVIAPVSSPAPIALPAGGDVADRFDPTEAWYPVFYVKDLDSAQPQAFTLLDQPLVIWWDRQAGQWQAFEDKCPHRLVPLSEGRVNQDGLLECPYHGWAFGGSGSCELIPQAAADSEATTSRRACVRRFATVVEQGMLFIYAGNADRATQVPVPLIEPLIGEPDGWTLFETFRDVPYDAVTLLENVLDPSHLPYTHHGTVGKRENAAPMELEIVASDRQGFRGHWAEGPRRGKLGPQDTTFIAPCLMWHDLISKQYGRTLTVVYATPTRKGQCRLFARFPFRFSSKIPALAISLMPEWYSHLGQNMILEDDQIFLHQQERYLAQADSNVAKAFYLPTKADLFVFEFRQWFSHYQADPFPGQALPPTPTRAELLDRYHSHTQHCRSCRTALARIQSIRRVLAGLAIVTLALSPIWAFLSPTVNIWMLFNSGLAIAASAGWWGLGRLADRLIHGRLHPVRNQPEKTTK
jgi:phenylpropionate dioxygenase-like ring-hydroxylating dioxygenase large terminal subunit